MFKGRVPLFPFLLATAVLCVVAAAERPVHAVSCCHDFTVWKVAGDDVDHLSPRLLRALLRGSGYVHVLTVAAETRVTPSRVLVGATPDTSLLLRPADLKLTWTTTGAGRDG